MVITELDEIAWILNLRGEGSTSIGVRLLNVFRVIVFELRINLQGLYHSPLFESQVLVTPDEVTLWIHTDKLNTNLTDHLQKPDCNDTCVGIRDIDDAIVDLASWGQTLDAPQKILLTQVSMYLGGASFAVYEALPEQFIQFGDSPVLDAKSVKNEVRVVFFCNDDAKVLLTSDLVLGGWVYWNVCCTFAWRCCLLHVLCRAGAIYCPGWSQWLDWDECCGALVSGATAAREESWRQFHHHRRIRIQWSHHSLQPHRGDQCTCQWLCCLTWYVSVCFLFFITFKISKSCQEPQGVS